MNCTAKRNGEQVSIVVVGDVDGQAAADLKERFEGLDLTKVASVSFDFGRVTHIGSAGLGKLLLFYKKLATVGARMQITGAREDIRELLRELKLDSLFVIA